MKNKILFLLLFVVYAYSAKSADFEVNGIAYNIIPGTTNCVIAMKNTGSYSGTITVPSTVTYNSVSYTVTAVGDYAFNNSSVTSVSLPNTITSINQYAFAGCHNLASFVVPDAVTELGECAFALCGSLKEITFSESLATVGRYAFQWCESLKELKFTSLLNLEIKENAFFNCTRLTDVYFYGSTSRNYESDDNGNTIANNIFEGCNNLKSIHCLSYFSVYYSGWSDSYSVLPLKDDKGYDLYYIGRCGEDVYCKITEKNDSYEMLFYGNGPMCSSVENIWQLKGGNCTDIAIRLAFYSHPCDIIIEEGITSICGGLFNSGYSLIENGLFGSGIIGNKSSNPINSLIIPSTLTTIGPWAFAGNRFQNVVFPESVKEISNDAFYETSFDTIDFLGDINSVGDRAFGGGTFGKLHFYGKINKIGGNSFMPYGCDYIGNEARPYHGHIDLIFEKPFSNIDLWGFSYCNIETLDVTNSITFWCHDETYIKSLYLGKDAKIENDTYDISPVYSKLFIDNIIVDDNNPYYDSRNNCNAIIKSSTNELLVGSTKNITIPKSVTSIKGSAYSGTEQKTVVIPPSVEEIGEDTFGNTHVIYREHGWDDNGISFTNYNGIENVYLYSKNTKYKVSDGSYNSKYKASFGTNAKIQYVELSLNTSSLTINRGSNAHLTAIFTPEVPDQSIVWTSSDQRVASVDENGKVTARATGTAIITATNEYGELTASCSVTVGNAKVETCKTPIIEFVNGNLSFSCDTEGVKYHTNITTNLQSTYNDSSSSVPVNITISAYASKDGYTDSETVEKTYSLADILSKVGDINGDGKVDIVDVTTLVNSILK